MNPELSLPPIIDLHFFTGAKPYKGPLSLAELSQHNAANIRLFYLEGQNQFVLSLFNYIENIYTNQLSADELASIAAEEISPQAAEDIMTIAEQMRRHGIEEGLRQGIEQGIEQGKIETAKRMIAEGSDPVFIMKVTGFSLSMVRELQKN
jgi:predicted transposase/invertase (TIGR01784 family)